MFDIGWLEFLLLSGIALIFVRPDDLPEVMEGISNIVTKSKSMVRISKNYINEIVCDVQTRKNK
jgi:Sec-independent protein translocase protein TatA